jgi:uncharacterized MAPEG superfamily protein
MTSELFWLVLTAVLAASLWMPYIVGINTTNFEGKEDIFVRLPDHSKMEPWVQRSYRAHLNLLEQLLPFATLVIIAHLLKVSTPITAWCAFLFFWLRVAHAIGMISGLARLPLRPLLYVAGWLMTIAIAWQILAYAPRV